MTELFTANIISNGNTLSITNGNPYGLLEEDGLMSTAIERIEERAPQQHGSTDLGYLLEPRPVSLVIGIYSDDFWKARTNLISALAPYYSPALELILNDGSVRRLDCHLSGSLNAGSRERHGNSQRVGLMLRAGDPSFYNPTAVAVTFALGGGSDQFTVPTPVPTGIGASTINQTTSFAYNGTWFSYPQIRIVGPGTDMIVTNEATDEKLDFTGTTIAGGDYYDIDTRYGRKTVKDSAGANKISKLTSDSDLATFHLIPGTNTIRVTGSGVTTATQVVITYYLRYLGV